MPTTRVPVRTQAERTAGTRTAFVEATVNSLVELGLARTTTNIVRDAGVSLGALSHHFRRRPS